MGNWEVERGYGVSLTKGSLINLFIIIIYLFSCNLQQFMLYICFTMLLDIGIFPFLEHIKQLYYI